MLHLIYSIISPKVNARHRRMSHRYSYTKEEVKDGCAKAFILLVLMTFVIRALWAISL